MQTLTIADDIRLSELEQHLTAAGFVIEPYRGTDNTHRLVRAEPAPRVGLARHQRPATCLAGDSNV